MDQVAAEHDPVLARVEDVAHMTGSVPRHGDSRQMVDQPLSVSDRSKQRPELCQMRLVGKFRDGIVRDHDPAQIGKRFSTIARQEPVQMVEMGMGEGDRGDRGRIDACLVHRPFEVTQ
jgi:hypothetical protein